MAADWPTCRRVHDPPCTGVRVEGFDGCLEHLDTEELEKFLATLKPGADLDARGTTLSAALVDKLLQPLCNADGHPVLGTARFTEARIGDILFDNGEFTGEASFGDALFTGIAMFRDARFDGLALFYKAQFSEMAAFSGTRFGSDAQFAEVRFAREAFYHDVRFAGTASFIDARFEGRALFDSARFDADVQFTRAWLAGDAHFTRATFGGAVAFAITRFDEQAWFLNAQFDFAVDLGPLRARELRLDGARFARSASVRAEAGAVSCDYTRFEDAATLNVRYGTVTAMATVFGAPSTIAGVADPFFDEWTDEPGWTESSATEPALVSLRGTDVSELVLTDVNLNRCEFAGAQRLDQLGLEGRCEFGRPPPGRWTSRQVLIEEARWRGWLVASSISPQVGPERLAALYRSLRKALEDAKYEAGAGDFYYGEMEMRRHSTETRRAERWILWFYWLLSGYGQRGGRALTALLVLIATVGGLLVFFGQPAGEAAKIAVGAVVLREAGTELTTAGEWTVMTARFLGPVLLALAVLAVRARVKR